MVAMLFSIATFNIKEFYETGKTEETPDSRKFWML